MNTVFITQLDTLDPIRCPCSFARRAFAALPQSIASLHLVDICEDSRAHYHKRMTEYYVVLEGTGEIELNGERFPIKPLTAICIPPGVRHRAIGKLRLINLPVPPFDENDEWFD